ncbi:hypothetical protein EAO69_06765 [Streptomyces sp. me109]|nr:hypothetical protein EAO69_06765 [Streptomyces sp. me109]
MVGRQLDVNQAEFMYTYDRRAEEPALRTRSVQRSTAPLSAVRAGRRLTARPPVRAAPLRARGELLRVVIRALASTVRELC